MQACAVLCQPHRHALLLLLLSALPVACVLCLQAGAELPMMQLPQLLLLLRRLPRLASPEAMGFKQRLRWEHFLGSVLAAAVE